MCPIQWHIKQINWKYNKIRKKVKINKIGWHPEKSYFVFGISYTFNWKTMKIRKNKLRLYCGSFLFIFFSFYFSSFFFKKFIFSCFYFCISNSNHNIYTQKTYSIFFQFVYLSFIIFLFFLVFIELDAFHINFIDSMITFNNPYSPVLTVWCNKVV
jgi:hypothetical protein